MDKKFNIFLLLILVGGFFYLIFLAKINNANNVNFESKSSESTITLSLTPKKFENNKFYVDINVDTHSIDLNQFDLEKLITLDINGDNINPITTTKLSGHHSSGTLIFEVDVEPKNFVIIARDFPDIPIRTFEW